MSKFEKYARKYLPIKTNDDMMTIFGDSRVFAGVVAYLKAEINLIQAKHPFKLIRQKLFSKAYITTHVLSNAKHGLVMVRMIPGPNVCLGLA